MAHSSRFATQLTQLGTLSSAQWADLAQKTGPGLVAGLAVIVIAWQAARLTWLAFTPVAPAPPLTTMAQPTPVPTQSAINPQSIADAHLFGLPQALNAADPANLPQTQIKLLLTGTIALDDPQAGYAIVGETSASAHFYKVGATISGLARLHSVYPDRVIIDRGGTLETLILPRSAPSTAMVPKALSTQPAAAVVDNIRRLASNPNTLSQLLRSQPVFANGTLKGFRVYPGRERALFERAGLTPGDLVTAVNGTPLDDPSRGNDILGTMTSSSTATISVNRNGQDIQLTLDMSQLPTADSDSSSSDGGSSGAGLQRREPRVGGTPPRTDGGTPPRPVDAP